MLFLVIGIALVLLKFQGIDPVAGWDWWMTLIPFGLAAAWWIYADASGYTKRKAMQRMDERKAKRIERQKEAMGIAPRKKR